MVPQHGHGAVGEAACTVMVTSLVRLTCSITRSERSGMMVIGSHWIWKTSRRRICLVLQYTTCDSSEPAEEPHYGKTSRCKPLQLPTVRLYVTSRVIPGPEPPKLILCEPAVSGASMM